MKTILLVDDDSLFTEAIALSLSANSKYKITQANSFELARTLIEQDEFDVLITDYLLDGNTTGHDLVEVANKKTKKVNTILLTAFAEKEMAIKSVNLKINYFLEKPFEITQLEAALQDCFFQNAALDGTAISIDENNLQAIYGETSVQLTLKEFKILKFLLDNKGKRLPKEIIISNVWPQEQIGRNVFEAHIYNLKEKLPILRQKMTVIRGAGYCINS